MKLSTQIIIILSIICIAGIGVGGYLIFKGTKKDDTEQYCSGI